jgi:predicted MFS family arabinose efflux permease
VAGPPNEWPVQRPGQLRREGRTVRPARWQQAFALLAASCLPILGSVILAPVLPQIAAEFRGAAGVAALAPMVLTAPALMISLTAPIAGRIMDRHGRVRALLIGLIVFAALGTAPLVLDSLGLIVISRVGLGIAEAFVMTGCTVLLGDFYTGFRRDRMLSLQTVVTILSSTVFFALGGSLGTHGWRTPLWLCLSSLLVAVALMAAIGAPRNHDLLARDSAAGQRIRGERPRLGLPLAVSLAGGFIFYSLVVELPFLLNEQGVQSAAVLGAASALTSLSAAFGAASFPRLSQGGTRWLLPSTFFAGGAGLLVVAVAGGVAGVIAGACLTAYAMGLLLPTLLTWVQVGLHYSVRGRVTGLWVGTFFFGQFGGPLLLLVTARAVNGLGNALGALGLVSLSVALLLGYLLQPSRTPRADRR